MAGGGEGSGPVSSDRMLLFFFPQTGRKGDSLMDMNGLTLCPFRGDFRWDHDTYLAARKANQKEREANGEQGQRVSKGDSKSLAEQAKTLLAGKESWKSSWKDDGLAREVEVGVDVNAGAR